ncbi:thiamine-phosphate kinase [Pseudorhodoplanes sinuspersici]|uniref:Thiamine-monophosphate kinase n=1 Tax=Pseudorhodoplanes sinuspersici TaxID=1235591 RepID=A0A1W7A0I9_9HYPH|nr:thiamine-phosphate kinase [Pseudorhodoplanes sinuspersici]ARQ03122.1 thiamine-phosphate kinase [Pseudorhodoplanes sinuspersici]RKE73263.1 thiamine-phosphate kinase [Pseudorhodoplanes sinuspersici]
MQSGEDKLIARYFKPLATADGALGLRDDAAFYSPPEGHELVLTADAIVSGVHFLPADPANCVAKKALRVNLSDLAAKGAAPAGCLMTLALPAGSNDSSSNETWLDAFASGLKADCEHFSCPVFGGDTVKTDGPLSVSIFAFGVLPRGTMVQRSGANPGDRVFVTGTIGDGALGLKLLREPARKAAWSLSDGDAKHLIDRYRVPQPRLAMAAAVRALASAAMDVSDGLVGDLAKLCDVSGVSARIEAKAIPLSSGARHALSSEPALIETIATGGDDYEILCTVAPDRIERFRELATAADIGVTDIGEILEGHDPPRIVGADGAALTFARTSFSHF